MNDVNADFVSDLICLSIVWNTYMLHSSQTTPLLGYWSNAAHKTSFCPSPVPKPASNKPRLSLLPIPDNPILRDFGILGEVLGHLADNAAFVIHSGVNLLSVPA